MSDIVLAKCDCGGKAEFLVRGSSLVIQCVKCEKKLQMKTQLFSEQCKRKLASQWNKGKLVLTPKPPKRFLFGKNAL